MLENARASAILLPQSADRAGDDEVAAAVELHAGDPPGELEVGLDAFERRVVGRCDEDRVDVAVAGARLGRQRMPRPRDGFAAERQMHVVELQRVELGDPVEGTRRRGHQLRPDAVSGETRNGLHASTSSIFVDPAHLVRSFVRPVLRAHFSCCEVGVCGVYRPRERNLPLAGENDDDRENDEPEHEQLRRKRRPRLEYAGC